MLIALELNWCVLNCLCIFGNGNGVTAILIYSMVQSLKLPVQGKWWLNKLSSHLFSVYIQPPAAVALISVYVPVSNNHNNNNKQLFV